MIDKLIPRYLNLDDDARLIKTIEMTDAVNVRISAEEDGDGGVIKNAYGNTAITFATGSSLAAGDNVVIGAISNPQSGEVFFFVWNSNDDHAIYRFSTSSNEAKLVYRDSVLGFSKFYHIRASVVKNLDGETLLYFTDANTDPKKINVTRALLGLYPAAFTSGTDAEKLACIAVAKQPPMTPPTFAFSTNPLLKQNNLYESTFQFAAQYVYEDGERSAISPYSELAISESQFFDGIVTEEQKLENNTLTVYVPTSAADVKEIIVLARNGNAGAFYEIGVLVNSSSVATQSIAFDNTKLYSPVSQDEVNKIYDNVPQTAEALTIAGNRLMLGGYTEGYENIRTDVEVIPNYFPQVSEYEISVSYPSPTIVTDTQLKRKAFDIDISSLPATTAEDSIINISFALDLERIIIDGGGAYIQWVQTDKASQEDHDYAGIIKPYTLVGGEPDGGIRVKSSALCVSEYIKVPAGTTKSDIVDLIKTAIEGNYNLVLDSDVTDFDYATQITDVDDLQGTTNSNKWMYFAGSGQLEIEVDDETSTYVRFSMSMISAALTAKLGYNFNVAATFNTALNIVPLGLIKSLFTRGQSLGQAFPATNVLFNKIQFVDAPSFIYAGDGIQYKQFNNISEAGNQFTPDYNGNVNGQTATGKTTFLTNEDIEDIKTVLFDANVLTRGDANGYPTFKAGANHSFGIVYYDQFNRNGGVQTIPDMYVNWFDNRLTENSLYGRANAVLRVKHNAPLWAKKWAPVYAPINSITQKFQYSITGAYVATNLQAKPFAGVSSFDQVTYLSLRSLEGKSDSYKESFGANLEYTFTPGDRLRIVAYNKNNGQYTFNVTSSTGTVAVGDVLIQIGIGGLASMTVTQSTVTGGSGTIVAVPQEGSIKPTSSGTLINVATGVSAVYNSLSITDLFVPSSIDLEVIGYSEFTDDVDSNPILDLTSDEGTFNTTGRFVVVRSSSESGWDNYSISSEADNWRNDCIVEIYRFNKPSEQQIFYEVGESFPVVNGVHVGQRTVISQFSVNVINSSDRNNMLIYSNIVAYRGDILTDGSGRTLVVKNVYPQVNGIYNYVFYGQRLDGVWSNGTYTLNITNSSDAVVQLENGDAYYRPRLLKVGDQAYTNNYKFAFIEDYSVSDFFSSKSTSIGRPHAVQPDAKTVFRSASVTYSEPFVVDSKYLGLSSFNPSLANFYDFEYLHGTIKQLVGDDDRMYIIQERKSGWAPIGRNVIESSDGLQSLSLSRNVVSAPNYYVGDYGINNNPESLAVDRGRIYFADIRSGKVIRISRDGITLISEAKMDAFFKENFRYLTTLSSSTKVTSGIDVEADEYIISSELLYNATVTISTGGSPYSTYNVQTNAAGTRVIAEVDFDDDELFTFSTEIREFDDLCDEFDDSLNCIVFLDKLVDGQPAYVGEEFIGQSGTIYGVATDTSYNFFVTIAFDLSTGEFYFTNDCGDYSGTIGSPSGLVNDFTVGYDVEENVWNTKYSYRPEAIVSVDDELYTFKNGVMYSHNSSASRANYYGVQGTAVVEVVSNANPSMVKSYEAISLEGNSAWAATITNTDQLATILTGDFSERERNWYAYVPRDSSVNTGSSTITQLSGTSEVFTLGAVATGGVSGATLTFTTPVGDIPFPIGGALYKVSGATLVTLNVTVSSISGLNQITASGSIVGVSAGDTIVVIANGAIEGDNIRDYYVKARLSNNTGGEVELYAINLVYAKSNLHNELGQ